MVKAKPHQLRARCSEGIVFEAASMRRVRAELPWCRCALGADEAEDDGLAFGNEAERSTVLELVVVLKEEAVDVEGGEEFFGDGVVATLSIPVAAVVAAAEMDAEGDAGDAGGLEALVVGSEGFVEGGFGVEAHLVLSSRAIGPGGVVAVAGSVDLDIVDEGEQRIRRG